MHKKSGYMILRNYFCVLLLLFSVNSIIAQDTLPMFSKAPLFEAIDVDSNQISLQTLIDKGNVIVIFYRGQWCPYCNRYMSDLQDSLSYITDLGASVVAITPENDSNINKTRRKSGASFSIIYDKDHKIMDAYNVSFRNSALKTILHLTAGININKASGNTDNVLPVPATYIINTSGLIIGRHFDKDYTKRMPVSDILKTIKNNAKLN